MIRIVFLLASLALVSTAFAQTQTARGTGTPRVGPGPRAAHNSTAKDTTPFNCEQYRRHPHPGMKRYCDQIESGVLKNEARHAGRPGPSTRVIDLPPMGSPEARRTGLACIGGQAMQKLPNGWEQVQGADGWQRCRGG